MGTPVYWNNLNLNGDWADAGNWSNDKAGSSPRGSFDGTEYFLWTGTGPNATDTCTATSTSLGGSGMDYSQNVESPVCDIFAIAVNFFFTGNDSDAASMSDPRPFTVGVTDGVLDQACGLEVFDPSANTVTIDGSGTLNIQFMSMFASNSQVNIEVELTLNQNGLAGGVVFNLASNTNLNLLNATNIYKANGANAFSASGGAGTITLPPGAAGFVNGIFAVYNIDTTAVFQAALTVVTSGIGSVSLNIFRGPFNVAVPQWAIDQSFNNGDLRLDFARFSPVAAWNGTTINGFWTNLNLLDGCTFRNLSFSPLVTQALNVVCGYRFEGLPCAISCVNFIADCAAKNSTAVRYWSTNPLVVPTLSVSNDFTAGSLASGETGNIQFGIRFLGDHLTVRRFNAAAIQGWDTTTFDRDVTVTGINSLTVADVMLGNNASLRNLSASVAGRPIVFRGRPAVDFSPGSDVLTLTGKLNLPDNDLRFRCIPNGTYRINFAAIGASSADVAVITGAILPIL